MTMPSLQTTVISISFVAALLILVIWYWRTYVIQDLEEREEKNLGITKEEIRSLEEKPYEVLEKLQSTFAKGDQTQKRKYIVYHNQLAKDFGISIEGGKENEGISMLDNLRKYANAIRLLAIKQNNDLLAYISLLIKVFDERSKGNSGLKLRISKYLQPALKSVREKEKRKILSVSLANIEEKLKEIDQDFSKTEKEIGVILKKIMEILLFQKSAMEEEISLIQKGKAKDKSGKIVSAALQISRQEAIITNHLQDLLLLLTKWSTKIKELQELQKRILGEESEEREIIRDHRGVELATNSIS